jgi:type VI secretion system ImpA family protein
VTVEELIAPVAGDDPAGPDLADDPVRQEIELAFEDEAATVDWRRVIGLIEGQSGKTKDVWLAIYLARAGALSGRLDVVVTGVQMLAGLFEGSWDALHPKLEDYGFQGRKGPCESLTRIGPFLGPLRRIPLVEHPRLGTYSGADLQRFEAEGDTAEGFGMFRHAVRETEAEALQGAIDALDAIREAIRRVDAALMARGEGDTGTDFKPAYEAIEGIRRALAPYAGLTAAEEAVTPAEAAAASEPAVGGGGGAPGRIASREDVVKAIDAIAEYYQKREPGSPVPVALRRVRAWVTMDFMAILKDIAPNSVSEAGTVLLQREEEKSSW